MKSYEREIIKAGITNEEWIIRQLTLLYNKAYDDIEEKIKHLTSRYENEGLQSIIYQLDYQKALKTQIKGILDVLYADEHTKISEYLNICYEEGFLGTMYSLNKQGIPLILPIDQEQAINAIVHQSKLSKSLYERLGEDVSLLKKKVSAEISRGIANNYSLADIARNLKNVSSIGINNALRIARTEGHRIQTQSQLDAAHKAKEKGADMVKQWDSTLDGRTRESHQHLDGQIRELDEPFEINGHKVMAPGQFGVPSEDVNCRCAMLQRARWALDDDELKTLQDRAKFYGLDKTENLEDFKTKYYQAANDLTNNVNEVYNVSENNPYGFKVIKGEHSAFDDIKVSNPNYEKGREYKLNCQRCCPTYEMRRRGYDVEALPRILEGNDDISKNWQKIFKGAKWNHLKASRGLSQKKEIIELMKGFGEGARAEIYVTWKGGRSPHVFMVENIGGEIHFIDPQPGRNDVAYYFEHIMPKWTMICRLDQLEPTDLIKGCCK